MNRPSHIPPIVDSKSRFATPYDLMHTASPFLAAPEPTPDVAALPAGDG